MSEITAYIGSGAAEFLRCANDCKAPNPTSLDACTTPRPGAPYNQLWQVGGVAQGRSSMGVRTRKVDVGSPAPDFTLPSQSGALVSLKDFLGNRPVVLFFYPRD